MLPFNKKLETFNCQKIYSAKSCKKLCALAMSRLTGQAKLTNKVVLNELLSLPEPENEQSRFEKNLKQRFYCRACRRFFRENPIIPQGKKKLAKTEALPSPSHLALQLLSIAQEIGRTPTTADINKLFKARRCFSLGVYFAVFGSFQAALKKAKLPLRYNQEFDKEKLLEKLRDLRRRLKRALTARDVQAARKRGEASSLYHFQRAFGSVPQAIAAAGAARREFSKDEIKVYLRKLAEELKRVPTGDDISERFVAGETPSLKEILKIFGSLRRARAAAGISYTGAKKKSSIYWRRYTPEQLIEQLRNLHQELGRRPTDRDLNRASRAGKCAASTTFRRVFGGLQKAYKQAGI